MHLKYYLRKQIQNYWLHNGTCGYLSLFNCEQKNMKTKTEQ